MTNFFYHYSGSWQSLLQVWTLFVKVTIDWQWGRSREKLVKLWLEIILIQVDTFRRWLKVARIEVDAGVEEEEHVEKWLFQWDLWLDVEGWETHFLAWYHHHHHHHHHHDTLVQRNCTWHDWAAIIRMIRENIWLTNNEQCLILGVARALIRSVSHVYEGARSFLWSGPYNWNSFNGVIWTDISDWNLGR